MADEFDISGFSNALGANQKNSGVSAQNLGNIRNVGQSTGFKPTESYEQGIKDIDENLKAYGTKHGINTIRAAISRWAPPSENDTESYIKFVSQKTGINPDEKIDFGNPVIRHIISGPIILQEKGLKNLISTSSKSQQNQSSEPQTDGAFDINGFGKALMGQEPQKEETQQSLNIESTKANKKPIVENKTQAQMDEMFGNIPGYKQAQGLVMGAGKNISETGAAIQQLAGKGISLFAPETGEKIAESAKQNALKTQQIVKPYEEATPVSTGVGQAVGAVVNPINKVIPGGGASTLMGDITKGIIQGAEFMGLTTPVMDETKPFWYEKTKQVATGGVAGAAGGGLMHMAGSVGGYVGNKLGQAVDTVRGQLGGKINEQGVSSATDKVLQSAGIDVNKVAPDVLQGLKDQAAQSLKTGDVKNLKRYADAMTLPVPVPMLRGQVTRDAMQYAVEQNLRGITGVGEPITEVLTAQNKALISNLDKIGAEGARDVVSSGQALSNALKVSDEVQQQGVREAYKAFKTNTGKDLQVPLGGLAQDYSKINKDFGDLIPGPIKAKFEALGLTTGKPNKTFSIEDAEQLIKDINLRYDPLNKPQKEAFKQLNKAIESAIKQSGEGLSGEAAVLAKNAREAASKRFDTIDSIPALKDVIRGVEPDKFVQKHILQGKVNEINSLVKYLKQNNPSELAQLQSDIIGVIKNKTLNNVSAENATFSQAQLKNFLNAENAPKLARILTKDQMGALRQLNRTAENALYAPAVSAVNRSNTAAANANINNAIRGGTLNDLLGITQGIPGLSEASKYLASKNQSNRANQFINQAINPSAIAKQTAPISLLSKPGAVGATALRELIQSRNREQQ